MSKTTNKFSPEVRARAVRMILDHESDYPSRWSAVVSVAEKIGCALQTHEMLFDALTQAFRVLDGVPRRGIFDNMRTAVDRIGMGKARQVNARFAALASHADKFTQSA
jgi:hypothetical protein